MRQVARSVSMSSMIPSPWQQPPGLTDFTDVGGVSLQTSLFLCAGLYGVLVLLWGANAFTRNGALAAVAAPLTLMFTTTGQALMDKSLSSHLQTPGVIAIVEMAVCTGVLSLTSLGKLRASPKDQVMAWLIVPVFYAANVVFALIALQYVSLVAFTISRTMAPCLAIFLDMALLPVDKQQTVSFTMTGGLATTLAGAAMYGLHTSIPADGLMSTVLALVVHVLSRAIERRLLAVECKDMPVDTCSLICNSVGMLPVLAFVYATGEFEKVSGNSETWATWGVLFSLALFGINGVANSNARFECLRALSTASVLVMQNTSRLAAVVLSIVIFEEPATPLAWLGIVLNTIGSAVYCWSQLEADPSNPEQDETTLPPTA